MHAYKHIQAWVLQECLACSLRANLAPLARSRGRGLAKLVDIPLVYLGHVRTLLDGPLVPYDPSIEALEHVWIWS